MHPQQTVARVVALREAGLGARRIARLTSLPVSTVRDWLAGSLPRSGRITHEAQCPECGGFTHDFAALPAEYSYLLGLYLGDGCLSKHPREVYKLRITLDVAYPGIVAEARTAISAVTESRVGYAKKPSNCVEVYSYSKSWACLFPQHGPGRKHDRVIRLERWQSEIVERLPDRLLRGLIHSDGCRFVNTGRCNWSNPRYSFSNRSEDIRRIFCDACNLLGLHWTQAPNTVYVSRKADVARMDEFIGPKT